jgi:anti-sigma factor RsiW
VPKPEDEKGTLTMHLHGTTLERYVAGSLPDEDRARIDSHVANCLQCAHALGEHGAATGRWERRGLLRRLVWVEAGAAPGEAGERAERLAA